MRSSEPISPTPLCAAAGRGPGTNVPASCSARMASLRPRARSPGGSQGCSTAHRRAVPSLAPLASAVVVGAIMIAALSPRSRLRPVAAREAGKAEATVGGKTVAASEPSSSYYPVSSTPTDCPAYRGRRLDVGANRVAAVGRSRREVEGDPTRDRARAGEAAREVAMSGPSMPGDRQESRSP